MDLKNNFLKKAATILVLSLVTACTKPIELPSVEATLPEEPLSTAISYRDALGRDLVLNTEPQRVVALFGSIAEMWELAGGTLVGITSDALEEERIQHSDNPLLLGTNKASNLELLLDLEPDLVLLTAEIVQQRELDEQLEIAAIPHLYFSIDTFEDYLEGLSICTLLTDRPDLWQLNGLAVQQEIQAVRQKIPQDESPLVLLIRAQSTAAKGKNEELMAGWMLSEMGAEHLVNRYPSLLEELSLEILIQDDPEYIFITTMGDSEAALTALRQLLLSSPIWQELSAVQQGHCYLLPKELFHFKPNARWGEAYAYLAELLYPGLAPEYREAIEASVLR